MRQAYYGAMSELIIGGTAAAHDHVTKIPEIIAIEATSGRPFRSALSAVAQQCIEQCGVERCGMQYRADQQQAAASKVVDGVMMTFFGPVTLRLTASCNAEDCPQPENPDVFLQQVEQLYKTD